MKSEQQPSIPTIEGVKIQWEILGENYSHMDSCPQTFFYTLSNMLKLNSAQKIIEIACGSGKLVPMVLDLKNPNAEYYATDISQKMISIFKERLQNHFQKYESKLTFEEWINKMKLKIRLLNGQDTFSEQISDQKCDDLRKFDRIIANMVIMLTPDPQKMLKNLYDHSVSGCLFGLSVWANKLQNNLHTIFPELVKEYGFPSGKNTRSNFYLYKNVEQMAKKVGWQLVLNWQQKGIFPFLEAENFRQYGHIVVTRMQHLTTEQQNQIEDGFIKRVSQIITQKKPLQFPAQIYIFRKI